MDYQNRNKVDYIYNRGTADFCNNTVACISVHVITYLPTLYLFELDECELKHQIKRLQEYRTNGITTHRGANVYDKLKARREEYKKKTTILSDVLARVQVYISFFVILHVCKELFLQL